MYLEASFSRHDDQFKVAVSLQRHIRSISFLTAPTTCVIRNGNSNSNNTFIALNLYLMIDSKTQKERDPKLNGLLSIFRWARKWQPAGKV